MNRAIALIIVIMFLVIGSFIVAFLAIILTTEFRFGIINYNSERVFYSADSAVARAEQLVYENGDCSWVPDPPGYLEEEFHIPSPAGKRFFYRIYCSETRDPDTNEIEEVSVTVESGTD